MSLQHTLRVGVAAALALSAGWAHAQFSSPMRDVENPDRFPYQERASATIPVNFFNSFIQFPTPAGKRYILEFVSVSCNSQSASDSFPQVLVTTTKALSANSTQGISANAVALERRGPGTFGGFIYSGSANIKMYSDPVPFEATGGNGIFLNIFHSDTSVSSTCSAVITGHTITP